MKVIWFSHFIPFPPKGGSFQRSFNLIRQVSVRHEIHLLAFDLSGAKPDALRNYKVALNKYCKDVEFWELPVRWKSAQWWAQFAFSPLFGGAFSPRMFWSKPLDRRWRRLLAQNQGALLHFDSLDLALFAPAASEFRKVLNHHNCESAMAYRRAEKELNPLKKSYLTSQARKLAFLETRLCENFNVNTVVSDEDAQLLQRRSPRAHFQVVENGTDIHYFAQSNEREEPLSMIFAASLNWYPNLSAIKFFRDQIWPLIKEQCTDAHFYVAGQNPPNWLLQWHEQEPNVHVIANPEDMRPIVARAALFVCPIIDGGGTKLKILDAMAMGKAVVSTTIGAEGLRVQHSKNIWIADSPYGFAKAVLKLLQDEKLRQKLKQAGRKLVEAEYSWERIGMHLEDAYVCAMGRELCGHSLIALQTAAQP